MRLEIEPIVASPALPNYHAAESSSPENAGIEQTLKSAIEAAQTGDRNAARVLLFKVTEAEPSNVDAWLWLASVSEYPEELLGFLVRVLEIDPDNERARQWDRATRSLLAKTFVQRGKKACSNGQNEIAAQCFDEALEYDLSCESAWLGKSEVSTSVEEKELCLARVLDINSGNRDAQRSLNEISLNRSSAKLNAARVAAFAGDMRATEQTLESILAADPDNIPALKLSSQIVLSFSAKLEVFQRIIRLDPNDAFAREAYEYLTTELSLVESATREPSFVGLDPDPEPELSTLSTESSLEETAEPAPEVLDTFSDETPEPVDLLQLSTDLAAFEPYTGPIPCADDVLLEDLGPAASAEFEEFDGSEAPERCDHDNFEAGTHLTHCAFCGGDNDAQAFSCVSCHAILSMSDIDSLFSNSTADTETVHDAVTRMEAEWNLREFSEAELTILGLGHFNLHNFEQGLAYLHEASSLNPNNVILAGQVNAVAIRLDELRRQAENHGALPKGKTILVVDDSATVRKLISSKLEKCGHNVICAVDGVNAMEIIENVVPDLVLLDIAMPRMDGYSVCKLIRANDTLKDVPVVMISGKDGFFDKVRGRMAGTSGYITKPFGPETLMRALDTYLVRGSVNEFANLADVGAYEA